MVRAFTCGAMGMSDRSLMVDNDWRNKGRGMCYPYCGTMHIKEPLLLNGKSSSRGGSKFPLSLSEWSFTIIFMYVAI